MKKKTPKPKKKITKKPSNSYSFMIKSNEFFIPINDNIDLLSEITKLEKDLDEWKEKYYEALQELIHVKSDLEESLLKLGHIDIHLDLDSEGE